MAIRAGTEATPGPAMRDLGALMEPLMERLKVPGVAVGIVNGADEHVACFGVTSIENPLPVDGDTLFQIGSTTKTVTGTVVMQLVERGALELDTPLRTWLPDLRLADEDVAARVTMRHLLTHVGGWEGDYFDDPGQGDDAIALIVQACATLPQLTPLGAYWSYNNAGFYIAGRAVEVVTGHPFTAVVKAEVLDPLGMSRSFFFPADMMTYRFAVGHLDRDDAVEVAREWYIGRAAAPAGGIVSSVRDQLRYARLHLGDGTAPDGRRLLSAESVAAMQTPLVRAANPGEWMGLTWFVSDRGGVRLVRHGGATNGQKAAFVMVPERRFAVTVLTNHDRGSDLHDEVTRWALREYVGVDEPEQEPLEVDIDRLRDYAGRFTSRAADAEVRVEEGALVLQVLPKGGFPRPDSPPDPTPPPVRLQLLADDRILGLDDPLKGAKGQFLRQGGSITWLRLFGRLARRVE